MDSSGQIRAEEAAQEGRGFERQPGTRPVVLAWLKRRLNLLATFPGENRKDSEMLDPLTLGDLPTREQLRAAFQAICERRGRVLSVFTRGASRYYNQSGQLGRTLDVAGYQQFCTELFWPHAEHTFSLDLHRRRLIEEIKNWAGGYIRP